ncbi:phage/plasmid replication protein, II/X family [Castellaniella ginsengisoli]|uniref:Phage/plasmid replication protein, II/X family n=1 Tax=Castellaniella ginsengisoli TaxID=546114 RepID=A0AB39H173_9BURK
MADTDVSNVIPLIRASHGAERVRGTDEGEAKGLYVPVTRKVSLTDETKAASGELENPVFIDWVTISQTHHDHDLPIMRDGQVLRIDSDGAIEWTVDRRLGLEGSYDSRVEIRCDGAKVEFSGNISRYGRRDNLFGYSWEETLQRINSLLNVYSLPPFSSGRLWRFADTGWTWSGARVSRVDLTLNFAAFAEDAARAILASLSGHHVGRQKSALTPDGATVEVGRGSKYVYGKIYLKHVEIEAHRRKKSGQHVSDEVHQFCKEWGVLREEMTLKSRFLTQNNLAFVGELSQGRLNDVFFRRSQFRRMEQVKFENFEELPRHLRATYVSWRDGFPMNHLSRATFYKHRKALLEYGIDISVANNVHRLPIRVRTVDIAALSAPEWYRRKYG